MSRAARSTGVVAVGGLAQRLAVNPANVVMIDPSIDQTGATDVWSQLTPYATNTTLVPDGTPLVPTVVRFQPAARYNSENVWAFTNRFNVVIDFNGGELLANVPNPFGVEAASNISNSWFVHAGHGMDGTAPIQISGGLSNTKGVLARTTYWPVSAGPGTGPLGNLDRFRLAASQGGPAITLTGSADQKINMRNAPSPNPRAFLYSTDFPGNANYARPQLVLEGCTNCKVTDLSGNGGIVTGAQFNGATAGTRSSSGFYDARYEGQTGVLLLGGTGCQVGGDAGARLRVQYTLGDSGENIASSTYGPGVFLRWHDIDMIGSGRQGWTVGNGGASGVVLEDYSIIGSPRHLIDIEADDPDGSGTIQAVTVRRGYRRCGTDTIGDIAMGGESKVVTDIVIGGLEGHPLDGNLIVGTNAQGFSASLDSPFSGNQGPCRRGPITWNYNVSGGQIQLTTHQGSVTAEYTGLINPTGFTDTQLLQFQPITGTTLPVPCQINDVNETTRQVTLSHPAQSGGTQTITATFGGVVQGGDMIDLGNFALRSGWDGITGIGNIAVLQAGSGFRMFGLDYCSGPINVHGNTPIGGSEIVITNPYTPAQTIGLTGFAVPKRYGLDVLSITVPAAGGKVAVRAAIGQQQPQFSFIASLTSHWDQAGTVTWPRNWNTNTAVEGGVPGDFSVPGRPALVYRIGQWFDGNGNNSIASVNAGDHDGTMTADAHALEAVAVAQGNVPQWIRLFYEFNADWMAWAIAGQGNLGKPSTAQITAFCNACTRVVNRYKAAFNNDALLKVALCGMFDYGGGTNTKGTHDQSTYDAVYGTLGGTWKGGLIDCDDQDLYSNGPAGGSYVQNEFNIWEARAVQYGTGIGCGELGIGGTISPVVSAPPHNWTPAAWGSVVTNFFKSVPATGPGQLDRFEVFDIGGDGVFLDGRGGVLVPNGEGLAFAGAVEAALA